MIEEQSKRFICITYQGKQNGSVLLTNKQCTEQLKWKQILFIAKYTGEQQKSPKLLDKAMEEQFTCFICITYEGKQNGSVLLTNEWSTEQLE